MSSQLRKQVAKRISEILIENYSLISNQDIKVHQKTIYGGKPKTGRVNASQKLLIYGNDYQAAVEDSDIIESIVNQLTLCEHPADSTTIFPNDSSLGGENPYIEIAGCEDASVEPPLSLSTMNVFFNELENISIEGENPQNVGQFIDISQTQDIIDLDKAKEILDTEITELIPNKKTRQQRINDFFNELTILLGPQPNFEDTDGDGIIQDDFDSTGYASEHDVNQQSNPFDGHIVRLSQDGDIGGQTIQDLRNLLTQYLVDVDESIVPDFEEERPTYVNKSPGYVKLRNLNQGIIVRRQEGDDVGIEDIVETDVCVQGGPSYLCDGFTITMWVRFLDKVNTGTLFNYGNPTRQIDPKGFKVETFVINQYDPHNEGTWGETYPTVFTDNDYARFIRVVVRETNGDLRDSHVGNELNNRIGTDTEGIPEFGNDNEALLVNYTQVPIDFDEWFFVVASYNPYVDEDNSFEIANNNPDFWLGYMDDASTYTSSPSGLGAMCKVEVISKSELIRARGYAPE